MGNADLNKYMDVQGFSHKSGSTFDTFHSKFKTEPMMATECCSCLSQRGEDYDACPVPRTCVGGSCHVDCAHLWAPYAAQCPGEVAGHGSTAIPPQMRIHQRDCQRILTNRRLIVKKSHPASFLSNSINLS